MDQYTSYEQAWEDVANDMARIVNETVAELNEYVDAGAQFTIAGPYPAPQSDEGFAFTVRLDGFDEEGWIDVALLLANATEYDGFEEGEERWGVNVSADVVGYDGNILGGMTPYNYSSEVWTNDPDELKSRLALFHPDELASFIIEQAIPDHLDYLA